MKDERIQTTVNRCAAAGFAIWFLLMSISINYRLWILKQPPRDFWDFVAIYFIGLFYVFIARASKGALEHSFKRRWLTIGITLIIVIPTAQFIMGRIHSVVEVGATLIGVLSGLGLVIGMDHFLNRRWERKEGIEDEE